VRELLAAGADVNLADSDGETALISAAAQEALVKLLLASGADVHRRERDGGDAVYWAVLSGAPGVVRMLLDAGVEANRIYKEGKSLLDVAKERKQAAIVAMLKDAGAKSASQLEAGRAALEAEAKREKQQQKEGKRKEAADRAILPDFSAAAKSKAYLKMIKRLGEVCGLPVQKPKEVVGLASCTTTLGKATELQKTHREEFLKGGAYLFRCGRGLFGDDDAELLAILPTTDQFQVPPAMRTNGANEGKGLADVVAGLKAIYAECPFILTKATFDTIEGEFTQPIKNPAKLAKMMYELCSDIVDQGTQTVGKLAKDVKKTRRLFLWWD
jgi:hypothetical protein